jgi:hypothetical protein
MAERDLPCDCHETVGAVGSSDPGRNAELLGRAPQQQRIADRLRRRQQQQQARLIGKVVQPPSEALLDAGGQRHRGRQPKPARELRRGQSARKLHQCERIPTGLSHDPLEHALVQPSRQDGFQ